MSGGTDAALRLLGLARRAGRLYLGSGPVLRALSSEPPGIVFLARDAGGDLVRRIERARGESTIDAESFDGEALSNALGRNRLSVVSIHDRDFLAGIRNALSQPR